MVVDNTMDGKDNQEKKTRGVAEGGPSNLLDV